MNQLESSNNITVLIDIKINLELQKQGNGTLLYSVYWYIQSQIFYNYYNPKIRKQISHQNLSILILIKNKEVITYF